MTASTPERSPGLGCASTLFVLCAVVIGSCTVLVKLAPKPDVDPDASARLACQVFIRERLHDPASVEWVSNPPWSVSGEKGGIFVVHARYRARNGFGALRLASRTCTMRAAGTEWELRGLD